MNTSWKQKCAGSRVSVIALALAAALLSAAVARVHAAEPLPAKRTIAPGPFATTWESLTAGYACPEWFRDAKLGIWAHWGAQCVPGEGDWYARNMYMQGHRQYDLHLAKYGHPSEFGFMEIYNLWKPDRWEPEKLIQLFVEAGAKYFVAMANHEDNFRSPDIGGGVFRGFTREKLVLGAGQGVEPNLSAFLFSMLG